MDKNVLIKEVIAIIRKYLSPEYKIYLFGSWAKGNAVKTSDIDIGILGKKKIAEKIMDEITRETDIIPTLRNIDIVDLNAKSESFKKKVLGYGKIIENKSII